MILYEEIYFEITLSGTKSELKKFAKFLISGVLDDFLDVTSDMINYDDDFATADDGDSCELVFANDAFGIETEEFDVYEFLDVFCKGAKALDVVGHIYDINDEEFNFTSAQGSIDYKNSDDSKKFNDELDEVADFEEYDEE